VTVARVARVPRSRQIRARDHVVDGQAPTDEGRSHVHPVAGPVRRSVTRAKIAYFTEGASRRPGLPAQAGLGLAFGLGSDTVLQPSKGNQRTLGLVGNLDRILVDELRRGGNRGVPPARRPGRHQGRRPPRRIDRRGTQSSDPADRDLEDVRAIALADIPEEAKYLMVAGFCRSAIESVSNGPIPGRLAPTRHARRADPGGAWSGAHRRGSAQPRTLRHHRVSPRTPHRSRPWARYAGHQDGPSRRGRRLRSPCMPTRATVENTTRLSGLIHAVAMSVSCRAGPTCT
jgi:hypothetical protein